MNKELRIRFNGVAKWSVIILFTLTFLWNTYITHVIMANDVEHIKTDITKIEKRLDDLTSYLMNK